MIIIRADANEEIGSGHVMRCMAIAKKICEKGERVLFIIADERTIPVLERFCAKPIDESSNELLTYCVLHTNYKDMLGETQKLEALIKKYAVSTMLIDSYFVDEEYLSYLKELCRVFYIDDVNSFDYPVDAIINYNIYGETVQYNSENKELFLGTRFVPLRDEFEKSGRIEIREKVSNILITTGGADMYGIAEKLVEGICSHSFFDDITIHVICGAFSASYDKLDALSQDKSNLKIYKNVTNMSQLMGECDMAISAGGSTMYELSAMGIPTICFYFVDNQRDIAKTYGETNGAIFVGDYRELKEAFSDKVIYQLEELINSKEKRQSISDTAYALVDGLGAERIAELIV